MSGHVPPAAAAAPGHPGHADRSAFDRLLRNTLLTGLTSSFLWFALTFWVYLETRSVVATGIIGGSFSVTSAVIGPLFGTFVDRHRKRLALVVTNAVTLVCFAVAAAVYLAVDTDRLLRLGSPWFWALVASTLSGSVAAQMRGIALSTCVSLLVPETERDRANGRVGIVTGVTFALTSVFSGLVIGTLGMGWAYTIALVVTAVALAHLLTIRFREPDPTKDGPAGGRGPIVDVRGAIDAIKAVPGLWMLVGLAAFNNLLAGVFLALIDAYGLELVSVETWGLLWGGISLAFIAGGVAVARFGLGPSPVRVILAGNLVNWTMCALFAARSSIALLTIGMVIWLSLIPVIEAAEQTTLQRVIPYERQGRVFGFAQLVENAASPLTAFLVAPLAEAVFMPAMTDGWGADRIGGWFGTGPDRGLALMFTLAGIVGIVATAAAWRSQAYRRVVAATA